MAHDDKTTAVRKGHHFDEQSLERYLTANLADFAGPLEVSQFSSGQSNPTFLLSTPNRRYVLRKKPPGELLPSAHQVEREFKIMSALRHTPVPVPEMLHLCQDPAVIGTNFFVMAHVQGRIFDHPSLPDLEQSERAAIYGAAATVLADLHKVDFKSVGLEEYGRREGFVARQLARWSKQYQATATEPIIEMDELISWLGENIPSADADGSGVTLVHGDFRLDNMIFHPQRPEVLAVLDWELSTLGNPLSDLGYFSMLYHLPSTIIGVPGLQGLDLAQLGIPDEKAFFELYKQASAAFGNSNSSSILQRYFVVFSLFRLAAIAQGVYARARQGVASSANADAVGRMAGPCAKLAWKLVQQKVH